MAPAAITATTPLLPSSTLSISLSTSSYCDSATYKMATAFITGAFFGAAMVASSVIQQNIIISQFQFTSFHMLETFLMATASTALIITSLQSLGYPKQFPRKPSTISLFPYDGNVIGGSLLGTGMALTGSCPGTIWAQFGVLAPNSVITLAGGITGGVLFTSIVNPLLAKIRTKLISISPTNPSTKSQTLTISQLLSISETTGTFLFALATASFALYLNKATPPSPYSFALSPLIGGLLIGLSQLLSATLRSTLLGISGSFEELAKTLLSLFYHLSPLPSSYNNTLFATGVAAGAAATGVIRPEWAVVEAGVGVTGVRGFVGGLLMVVGARVAGGCTSGHGISGMGLLSLASFVTIGMAFGVAGVFRSVLL